MEDYEKIELRSDEVQEILGTPPSWLVRWGTTVIFLTVAALIAASFWINYPDLVQARAMVTTAAPPVEVVSRASGPLQTLLVKDGDEVQVGQVMGVLGSPANPEDITRVESLVTTWLAYSLDSLSYINAPEGLSLGEIQNDYSIFIQNLGDFKFLNQDKSLGSKDRLTRLNSQISNLNKRIKANAKMVVQAEASLEYAESNMRQSNKLLSEGLISANQHRMDLAKVNDAKRDLDAVKARDIETQMEITNVEKLIGELRVSDRQDSSNSGIRLRESLSKLNTAIIAWKQQYLLISPIKGRVVLNSRVIAEKQFVNQGEPVMTVSPPDGQTIIARLELPLTGAGKVKPGQRVILRLASYPYPEFGTVEGTVNSKSELPKDGMYTIIADLPNGLKTTRGLDLKFEQQLMGEAQIVTEKRRVIDRFLDKIFAKTESM